MDRKLVTTYLLKEDRRETKSIIERELKIKVTEGKITSIIGPRRAGKTYFLYKLREKFGNFLHINFEHTAFSGIQAREIYDVISLYHEIFGRKPENLFLDEVQKLKDWQTLVRSFLDSEEYTIFISGSSSKLLSREIATQLRGRTLSYLLLPFSFREYLGVRNFRIKKFFTIEEEGKIRKLLREFLSYGSYPEVALKKEKERILKEYYNTILYNDFVERFGIRNVEAAKFLFEFCFQNFSKEFSVRKFINYFSSKCGKTAKHVIYDYVEKLPETLAIFFVEKFSKNIYERKSWPRKIYVCDLGLSKVLGFDEEIGKKMENVVFLELLRKINVNPLINIYFLKSKDHEVDFVLKEGLKVKQLIQVTYASAGEEIERREIKALLKASDELKCQDLLCITWDYEDEEKIKGKKIKFVPLWRWLLHIKTRS